MNRSGAEFACVQGKGVFDGPADDASVSVIACWKANIVRVPLNEDCRLGESNVLPQYGGAAYQAAIKGFVNLLHHHGTAVILDLHWTDGVYTGQSPACSVATATCQKPMPEHINAVRGAGAGNVLMLGGVAYSNDLSQWLAHEPSDPLHNLAASWHSYNLRTLLHRHADDVAGQPPHRILGVNVEHLGLFAGSFVDQRLRRDADELRRRIQGAPGHLLTPSDAF